MRGQMNRRTALGAVAAAGAAGLTGLLGGSSVLSAAAKKGEAAPSDQLGPVIADEINNSVRDLIRYPGPGARRFAGALRMHAAHFRSKGGDEQLAEYYASLVRAQGRDSVLMLEPDVAAIRATARQLGIDHYTPSPINPTANAAVLNGLLAGQYTNYLRKAASRLDESSTRFETRNTPGLRPVVYNEAPCIRTMEMEDWAWWGMKLTCAAAPFIPVDAPLCATATAIYLGVWAANQIEGCHG